MPEEVIITIENGLVQNIISTNDDVRVIIIDYDLYKSGNQDEDDFIEDIVCWEPDLVVDDKSIDKMFKGELSDFSIKLKERIKQLITPR